MTEPRGLRRLGWLWAPPAVLMVLMFAVSSMSDPPPVPGGLSDVSAHAIAYAVLAALVLRALARARWRGVTLRLAVTAVALTALYGVSDELHQRFVADRVAEARDLVADTVGALAGAGLVWGWRVARGSELKPPRR